MSCHRIASSLPTLAKYLDKRSLHGIGRFLTVLARKRCGDRQPHTGPNLNQFLASQSPCPREKHILLKGLFHDVLKELLLEVNVELLRVAWQNGKRIRRLGRRLRWRRSESSRCSSTVTNVDMYDRAGRMGRNGDVFDLIQDCAHGVDVLSKRCQNRRLGAENVDSLRSGRRQEWRYGGRKYEGCTIDTLDRPIYQSMQYGHSETKGRAWCLTTISDPAQKPPHATRPFAMEPISMSTCEA